MTNIKLINIKYHIVYLPKFYYIEASIYKTFNILCYKLNLNKYKIMTFLLNIKHQLCC
jgi:hypothetical protein